MIFQDYPTALKKECILNGRYIVQDVIGQGGFGITYKALDYQSGGIVAIKEYYPNIYVTRVSSYAVVPKTDQNCQDFEYGKEKFLEEARTLATFSGNPNIVKVYSFFEEPGTGTAYFVMEYVEGITLSRYLQSRGGRVSWQEARGLLLPIADALTAVHEKSIVHRDIKPDNILITSGFKAKLIDFGAARYVYGVKSQSLETVLTRGYAPMEQYYRHGHQGPWTDVYALAATMYFSVTGIVPPEAVERIQNDRLKPPSSLGIAIPDYAESALLKALAVKVEDRSRTAQEFAASVLKGETLDMEDRVRTEREIYTWEKEKELREQQEIFRQEEEKKLQTVREQARRTQEHRRRQAVKAEEERQQEQRHQGQTGGTEKSWQRQAAQEQARRAEEERRRQAAQEQARKTEEYRRRQAAQEQARRTEEERRRAEAKRAEEERRRAEAKRAEEERRREEAKKAEQAGQMEKAREARERMKKAAEQRRQAQEQTEKAGEVRKQAQKKAPSPSPSPAPASGAPAFSLRSLVLKQRLIVVGTVFFFLLLFGGIPLFGALKNSFTMAQIVLLVAGIFLLFVILFCVLPVYSGSYLRQAMDKLAPTGATIEEVERDIDDISCRTVLAGRKYLILVQWKPVIMPIRDLIWYYGIDTTVRHRIYGIIPAGKTMKYSVRFVMRDNSQVDIGASKDMKEKIIQMVRERAPGSIGGYSDELAQLRQKDFGRMISAVDKNNADRGLL